MSVGAGGVAVVIVFVAGGFRFDRRGTDIGGGAPERRSSRPWRRSSASLRRAASRIRTRAAGSCDLLRCLTSRSWDLLDVFGSDRPALPGRLLPSVRRTRLWR